MFSVEFDYSALARIEPELRKAMTGLPKELKKSASHTLRNAFRREITMRKIAGGGVTGRMENMSNWRFESHETNPEHVTTIVHTTVEYSSYLDDPSGPYPLSIDINALAEWCVQKLGVDEGASLTVAAKIQNKIAVRGHKSRKWAGFVDAAGTDAMLRLSHRLDRLVNARISKIPTRL